MADNTFGEGQGNISSTSVCVIEFLQWAGQCMYGVSSGKSKLVLLDQNMTGAVYRQILDLSWFPMLMAYLVTISDTKMTKSSKYMFLKEIFCNYNV